MSANAKIVPITMLNEQFLRVGFGDQWERAMVAWVPGDPNKAPKREWFNELAKSLPGLRDQRTYNMYFVPSLSKDGKRTGEFDGLYAVVIDDVGDVVGVGGVKVVLAEAEALLGPAHWVICTSPGSRQAGWWIEPIMDEALARALLTGLKELLGGGDKLEDPFGLRRLPVGINGKAANQGHRVDLEVSRIGVIARLDLNGMARGFFDVVGDLTPTRKTVVGGGPVAGAEALTTDQIYQAFAKLGMIKSVPRIVQGRGWGVDVICPWKEDHTGDDGQTDTTFAVGPPRWFTCQHTSKCNKNPERRAEHVLPRLQKLAEAQGISLSADIARDEFDDADPAVDAAVAAVDWKNHLQRTKNGFQSNLENVMVALRGVPEFGGAFGFNAFTMREVLHRELPGVEDGTTPGVPREWRDQDTTLLQAWLQRQGLTLVTARAVDSAVSAVMHERSYHPVRDWLEGLRWDGVERLDQWLHRYVGAPDDIYHRHIGRWFVMAMCRRVFEPGCRMDYMLVLEGPQGREKSTLLAALAGRGWFSDNLPDLTTKDASEHLNGRWLVEIAEMDRFDRSETSAMKAFLTRTVERYRRAYGRRTGEEPRQCVFAGTVNGQSYLKDETGNRRYWPVKTGQIDVGAMHRDRDQLFAEAWARAITQAEQYWPDAAFEAQVIAEEQDQRLEVDPWTPLVEKFLETKTQVLVNEVIVACTGGGAMLLNTTNRNRVTRIMATLKWGRGSRGLKGERFWYPPETSNDF